MSGYNIEESAATLTLVVGNFITNNFTFCGGNLSEEEYNELNLLIKKFLSEYVSKS